MGKLEFYFSDVMEWPLRDGNGILWIEEAEIGMLAPRTQEIIRRDIETRIIPQAKAVFEATPGNLKDYIEKECGKAANEMARTAQIVNSGTTVYSIRTVKKKYNDYDRTNVIHYIFNKERAKSLRLFYEHCRHNGQKAGALPTELQEQKARQILAKAIKEGLIKDDYSPTNKLSTKTLRSYFAMKFSGAMGWKDAFGKPQPRYAPFEKLWNEIGYGNLMRVKEYNSQGVLGGDIVDKFFSNL